MAPPDARALPVPAVQLITGTWTDDRDLAARIGAALRGGIRWIQLRAKDRPAREVLEAASLAARLVREAQGLFVVNDRVDVAIASGAGGVHLPEHGMPTAAARRLLGGAAWIARSVHSIDSVRTAGGEGLDALQFGPVYDTPSKRAFGEPQGLERLAAVALAAGRTNTIAVGGIRPSRAVECLRAGAVAVSVIGSVWDAPDVERAAGELVSLLRS